MKYKFKPSEQYDIRLLAETGIMETLNGDALSAIPILAGINYEKRLKNHYT